MNINSFANLIQSDVVVVLATSASNFLRLAFATSSYAHSNSVSNEYYNATCEFGNFANLTDLI